MKDWDWSFEGLRNDAADGYSHVLIFDNVGGAPFNPDEDEGYILKHADGAKSNGIAGMNNANPRANFENHALVKIGGTYYDPSYGATYDSLAQFQHDSLDGIYINKQNAMGELLTGNELIVDEGIDLGWLAGDLTKYFTWFVMPVYAESPLLIKEIMYSY